MTEEELRSARGMATKAELARSHAFVEHTESAKLAAELREQLDEANRRLVASSVANTPTCHAVPVALSNARSATAAYVRAAGVDRTGDHTRSHSAAERYHCSAAGRSAASPGHEDALLSQRALDFLSELPGTPSHTNPPTPPSSQPPSPNVGALRPHSSNGSSSWGGSIDGYSMGRSLQQ